MKRIAITLLLVPIFVFGQQVKDTAKKDGVTNIERFSERSGTLIQREFIDVGSIASSGFLGSAYRCEVQLFITTDLINKITSKGVRFEYHYSGGKDTRLGYLDADEIDETMKAIKIIQTEILNKKVDNYTEVFFSSRGGFSFGCNSKMQKWEIYMDLNSNRRSTETLVRLTDSEVEKLYLYLQQIKNKL